MQVALDIGPYRLLRKLAKGGMGEVYVAVRRGIGNFQKPTAVKLLLPHLLSNEEAVRRFLDEARVSALMSHPNIAQVFDVGLVDDRYFLAMELVRGASLSRLIGALKTSNQMASAEVIAFIGRSLCDGLGHAHSLRMGEIQVVHRDVTPHNVLISVDGVVKVTDFGIARIRDESQTLGTVLGKPAYMAPEQSRGQEVDARADVFGIGITLFHLATLTAPFSARSNQTGEVDRNVDLDVARPDLPETLRAAIKRAIEPDVSKRTQSARALRDALPEAPEGQDALALLIRTLCASVIEHVDQVTRMSRSVLTPIMSARLAKEIASPRANRKLKLGLAAVGLVALFLALWSWRSIRGQETDPLPDSEAMAAVEPKPAASNETFELDLRATNETPTRPLMVTSETMQPVNGAESVSAFKAKRSSKLKRRLPPKSEASAAESLADTPSAPGFLSVTAEPWAYVYIDGTSVGETPLAKLPLSPGTHTLRFLNPDTKRDKIQTIQIVAGQKAFARAELK